jgi:thiamine pyrophosphate-dependent acetolactate synthase large subunit-like protein
MSPSTAVGLFLAGAARKMGLIVEQGEDEIGAINLALGASFTGAPAMVSTSGGGFALMVEAVSLADMTETPIVIAVGQRPAPARPPGSAYLTRSTGIPITGQISQTNRVSTAIRIKLMGIPARKNSAGVKRLEP